MNNDSAKGYVIMVLKTLEFSEEQIDKVLDELHIQFDTITEYEAEQYYTSGDWRQ